MWQRSLRKKKSGGDDRMGNQRLTCQRGHSHRSKLEGAVCQMLRFRELAGELVVEQVEDHILISGWYLYIPDFRCRDTKTGDQFWVEAKGFGNDRWPSTKKGWRHAGPGRLEVWGGSHVNPRLLEIIEPKGSGLR